MRIPTSYYARVRHLLRQNRLSDAEYECRKQLKRVGQVPALLALHGQVVERSQGWNAALPIYAQAAQLAPHDGEMQELLAACLERAGRLNEACNVRFAHFVRGERHPPSLMALARLLLPGRGEIKTDRIYRTIDFVRAAMDVLPNPLDAAAQFIEAAWAAGEAAEALAVVREVLALAPDSTAAWNSYAFMLLALSASAAARRALGHVIVLTGDDRARLMRALSFEPAHWSRAAIAAERQRLDDDLEALLVEPALRVDIVDSLDNFVISPFYLAYHGEDDRPLAEKMAEVMRRAVPGLTWVAPHVARPRSADRPIRVGVLGQFATIAIFLTTAPLFQALDRQRFSVTLYSVDAGPNGGDGGRNHGVKILPWSIRQAREMIAADENDILIYTEVFMTNLYYFLAYSRLATHQILRPGHPVTSGLKTMDYALTAWPLERQGAQVDYTETLIHLKELCTDYPRIPAEVGEVSLADFGVPAGRHLYLCCQTWVKMHPDFDEILRRILIADPDGVLLLFDDLDFAGRALFRERLSRHLGDAAGQLIVLPRQPLNRYMGLLAEVDVCLDTYHFSGGNTSYQAMQMGVPTITRPPLYMRGRGTASFYRIMGFEELVANSDEAYVALAVRVATDRDYRDYCRREILDRSGRLFDREDVVHEYEELFEAITFGADLRPWQSSAR